MKCKELLANHWVQAGDRLNCNAVVDVNGQASVDKRTLGIEFAKISDVLWNVTRIEEVDRYFTDSLELGD